MLTDWPERLAVGASLWLEGAAEPRTVIAVEAGGRTPIVFLDGIASREAAEAVAGSYLEAPTRALPAGTYFWDELIGLAVVDPEGRHLGEVTEVFRAGGNEVYRVMGPAGERLVPALRSVVLDIDLSARRMTVAPDEAEEVR